MKSGEGSWVATVDIAGLGQRGTVTDGAPFEPDVRGETVNLAFGRLFLFSTAATAVYACTSLVIQ